MYKHNNAIQCPYCKKEQFEPLIDLTEGGDMEGSFDYDCENCNEIFIVHFEFRPFNYTQKKDASGTKVKEVEG